jgi:hypothetical protein
MKLTPSQTNRFNLVEKSRKSYETNYQANLGQRGAVIRVRVTAWYAYVEFAPPIRCDDEQSHFRKVEAANLMERMNLLYRTHKARHKRLRAVGNDCWGSWWYCDMEALEAILKLLLEVFQ